MYVSIIFFNFHSSNYSKEGNAAGLFLWWLGISLVKAKVQCKSGRIMWGSISLEGKHYKQDGQPMTPEA